MCSVFPFRNPLLDSVIPFITCHPLPVPILRSSIPPKSHIPSFELSYFQKRNSPSFAPRLSRPLACFRSFCQSLLLCSYEEDESLTHVFGVLYTAPRILGRKAQGALMTPERVSRPSDVGLEYRRRTLMKSYHKRLDIDSRPRRPMRRLCPKTCDVSIARTCRRGEDDEYSDAAAGCAGCSRAVSKEEKAQKEEKLGILAEFMVRDIV